MPRPVGSKNKVKRTHCKKGHPKTTENTNAQGQCKVCNNIWSKARQKERRQNDSVYADKIRKGHRVQAEKYRKEHPDRKLEQSRRANGWTCEAVDNALLQQGYSCAICNELFSGTPCADHKHADPPTPRGMLCRACNAGLGLFKDRIWLLKAAAEYLTRHGEQ